MECKHQVQTRAKYVTTQNCLILPIKILSPKRRRRNILVGGNKLSNLGGGSSVSSVSWVAEATPWTTTLRRLTLLAAACAAGALVDGPQGRHCIRGGGGFVSVCGARAAIFGSLGIEAAPVANPGPLPGPQWASRPRPLALFTWNYLLPSDAKDSIGRSDVPMT